MYAKIFAQMYDGTLATNGPWQALVTFQQLLVLADQDGVVDMTIPAIVRRTTVPEEIIRPGIEALMLPDPESRTPTEDGRRIVPLSPGRAWGWRIVNYVKYRQIKRETDRRDYHREYWHKRKDAEAAKIQQDSTGTQHTQHTQQDSTGTQHAQPIAYTNANGDATSLRSVVEPAQADSPPPAKLKRQAKPKVIISRSELLALGINEDDLDSWLTRRGSRSPVTKAVLADHEREAQAAGLTLPQAIAYAAGKGWVAFNAAWYANARRVSPAIGRQAGAPVHRGPKLGKSDFVEGMEDGIAF